jgi:hypothetical protein
MGLQLGFPGLPLPGGSGGGAAQATGELLDAMGACALQVGSSCRVSDGRLCGGGEQVKEPAWTPMNPATCEHVGVRGAASLATVHAASANMVADGLAMALAGSGATVEANFLVALDA